MPVSGVDVDIGYEMGKEMVNEVGNRANEPWNEGKEESNGINKIFSF